MLSTPSDPPIQQTSEHPSTMGSTPHAEAVLIIGGGSGGCATAITLAEAGFDPQSDVHKRHYAIKAQHLGWWECPTMKLLLLFENARLLLASVQEHVIATQAIHDHAPRLVSTLPGSQKIMRLLVTRRLERNPPQDGLDDPSKITSATVSFPNRLEKDASVLASATESKTLMNQPFTALKPQAPTLRNEANQASCLCPQQEIVR